MLYIAFTLGLFGSLHCVGMCGPLAIAFCNRESNNKSQNVKSALAYNLGRTSTYALLGLFFGILGSFIFVSELQKIVSIILGALLVLSFLFSVDIDSSINNNSVVKKYYFNVKKFVSDIMSRSREYHPYQLGMANGLLPCGLVYLALAGALTTGSVLGGVTFMVLFGLGTLPMLFALTTGFGLFSLSVRRRFRTVLPFVTLCFGLFLIYRGLAVDLPSELNFWKSLRNPIMCH